MVIFFTFFFPEVSLAANLLLECAVESCMVHEFASIGVVPLLTLVASVLVISKAASEVN